MYPEDSEDPSKLQGQADMAMYSAKSQGKSRYQFYRDMPAPAVVFGP
jgi:PleD family two-component response regulator